MNKIFKYINPIYYFKRRKYKKIYNILINAKDIYTEFIAHNKYVGMCICIAKAFKNQNIIIGICEIKKFIPEFNRKFCNANNKLNAYWWDTYIIQPRINAFCKLINHYENLIKEL